MDYLYQVLLKVEKNILISVPYVLGLNDEFRRTFYDANVQVISKGTNTLKSIIMHLKDKILLHPKQNIAYKWVYPEESNSKSYIGESSRCLENEMKEYKSHVTNIVYIHSESNTPTPLPRSPTSK